MEPMLPKLLKFEEDGENCVTSRRHRRPYAQRNPFSLQERIKTARVVEEMIATGNITPIDNENPTEDPTDSKLEAAHDHHPASSAKFVAVCSSRIRETSFHLPPILPTDGSKPMSVVKDSRGFRVGGRRYIRRGDAGSSAARLPSIGVADARMLVGANDTAASRAVGSQPKDSKRTRSYAASEELPGEASLRDCDGQVAGKGGVTARAIPTVDEDTMEAYGGYVSSFTSDHTEHHMQELEQTLPTSELIATDGPLLVQGKNSHKFANQIPQAECFSTTFASQEGVFSALHHAPDPLGRSHVIMCRPPLPTKGFGPIHAQRDGNRYAVGGRRFVTTTKDCWTEMRSTLAAPRLTNAAHTNDLAGSSSRSNALGSRDDPEAFTTPKTSVIKVSNKSQGSFGGNWTSTDIVPHSKAVPSTSAVRTNEHLTSIAEMCSFKAEICSMVSQLTSHPPHTAGKLVASSPDQRHISDSKSHIASPTLTLSCRASPSSCRASPSHTASCSPSVPPPATASPSHSGISHQPSLSNVSSPMRGSPRRISPAISPSFTTCLSPDHSRCPTTSPPPIKTPPPTISPFPTNSIYPTSTSATITPLPTNSMSPLTILNLDESKKADSGFEEITTEDSCSEGEDESQKMESNQANEDVLTYGPSYFSTFQMRLNPSRERRAPRVQTAVKRRLD